MVRKVCGGWLVLLAAGLPGPAHAQPDSYPRKPIRLLVGFTPGGGADAASRQVSLRMGETLGVNIVVENRSGAAGSVAANIVARAPADGYTLLWSSPGALTTNRILEKNLPYDPDAAFISVGLAVTFCNVLVVRQDTPLTTVQQFIAQAKERPGQIQYATQGIGAAGHLAGLMLQNMAGIKLAVIPYKGGADIVTALIGGEVPSAFMSTTSASSMKTRIRLLAVTSLKRDPALPDTPSLHESGVTGYDATFWYGMNAPTGTPQPVITRLNRALRDAVAHPELARVGRVQGFNPAPSSPAEFTERIKSDFVRWKAVLGTGGV